MGLGRRRLDPKRKEQFLEKLRQERAQRDQGYREQALRLMPHICGRCGREFAGKTLRELTVHHRDGNHMNNPPDGSNWELLCLYCHDDEHQTPEQRDHYAKSPMGATQPTLGFNAFEGLKHLLPPEEPEEQKPAPSEDGAGNNA